MAEVVQLWDAHSVDPANNRYSGPYFNVYKVEERMPAGVSAYSRRDYYKIMLFRGAAILHFGNQSITIGDDTLLVLNSRVPYTFNLLREDVSGYSCVFKDEFFREGLRLKLDEIPLFMPDARPAFPLEGDALKEVIDLYEKMLREHNSDYVYKYELIRSYISELIYYIMKLAPSGNLVKESNATARVTTAFLDLLERQFPIEAFSGPILLRTPKDFADKLSIHVNYLNRAIKTETGKTTTDHIFDRLIGEAKAMLKHTNLNIAEISYALGFEDQAHFNNFFKKRVKLAPTAFRQA